MKIRQWVNHLGVKKKLVFYGYLIITPVLLLICLALLFNNYQKVKEQSLETDLSSVKTLADSIHGLQSEIKDFSTYICINNDVHDLLTTEAVEEKNRNAKLWLQEAPMEIVQDMISLKGHIKTIAIYPENGIRPYLRCMDGSAYVSDLEAIHRSEIYQETVNNKSGVVWKQVPKGYSETYETNRYDKVVLYREIFDLTQKKTLGYIVIGVDQQKFLELCQSAIKNDKEKVLVLDANGEELCRVGDIEDDILDYLKSDQFIGKNYRERETHFTIGKYNVVCSKGEANDSIICKITPNYKFQMRFLDVANMPVLLLLGMLIGLLPLLILISNIVTKPLSTLRDGLENVAEGDFEQQIPITTYDEIGEVTECFNKMVQDIKKLIDENYVITIREKESELAALQAQINPHFLYNTLDSLYWQAIQADNEEIAESILALSQLFRLVLNQGMSEVMIGQEMELVSRYLQIQKMRFTKRLSYEIHVDDSVKKIRIPKLVVQPFVENAIVHGFENVDVPCQLIISCRREEQEVCFVIRDTGVGMTQEQITEIMEAEPAQYAKQRIGRYAIKNIRERLELKYGAAFSLNITSAVGEGTVVELRLPLKEEC